MVISCYGYRTRRLNAINSNSNIYNRNTSDGQIAVSDNIVGIYYPYADYVEYHRKEEFLAGNFSRWWYRK